MRRPVSRSFAVAVLLLAYRAGGAESHEGRESITADLRVERIGEGLWRHVSYQELEGFGRAPANGLVLVSEGEAALIDTPWTGEQTRLLFDWTSRRLSARIETVVVGHSHGDCMGGLSEAHELGARSHASELTATFARRDGKAVPQNVFSDSAEIRIGGRRLRLRFVGPGHTLDNIVTWIPDERVLFGGCLVRPASARSLGYTKEADLEGWPRTLERIKTEFGTARLIVPGHGSPGGLELLEHSLELLRAFTPTAVAP